MLTGNLSAIGSIELQGMVATVARNHISRFPMTFHSKEGLDYVSFYDSRLPENLQNSQPVASLWRDGGDFCIESKLIVNKKYNRGNTKFHIRTTGDKRKMLKWLIDYVVPITPPRLPQFTLAAMSEIVGNWRRELTESSNLRFRVSPEIFIEDMVSHLLHGTAPYSNEQLKQYFTREFADKFTENKTRMKAGDPYLNVFINPDDTVIVNQMHVSSDRTLREAKITTQYNSFNDMSEKIKHQCAILKMVDNQVYVAEVGIKMSSNNFWIYP